MSPNSNFEPAPAESLTTTISYVDELSTLESNPDKDNLDKDDALSEAEKRHRMITALAAATVGSTIEW